MTTLIQFLLSRTDHFFIELNNMSAVAFPAWLEKELIDNPAVIACVESYSYQIIQLPTGSLRVDFSVQYDLFPLSEPVFLSQNLFELITAISSALRLHSSKMIFVVDNRKSNIDVNKIAQLLHTTEEFVGEELQIHQSKSSSIRWRFFFGGRIVVLCVNCMYFDTSKEINDLSCLLAVQAKQIRQKSCNDTEAMLNEIMYWFRNNVEYVNTNRLSDHSPVGLIRNRTAVCQGIAAYAYLLLYYCGIDARYVSGNGLGANGWEPHGWNMVFYHNQWRHIDYTFGLNSHSRTVLKTEGEFRRNHRWDETRYSPMQSSIVLNSKKTLRRSIITCIPNQSCLSINGCIIDMRHTHIPCIILANKVLISVLSVVALIGGCFCIKETGMQIFINRNQHSIPMEQLLLVNGNWYTEATNLNTIGFSLTIEGKAISFRYNS